MVNNIVTEKTETTKTTLKYDQNLKTTSSVAFISRHLTDFSNLQVYILGGVGDRQYYNDAWVLDLCTCSWTQLDTCGQQPQGRFSHTAVVADSDIAIYGG